VCAVQKIVVTVVPVWQSSQSDTIIQSTQFSRVEMEWINDGLLICGKTREKERTLSLFLSLSRSLSLSHTHTHILHTNFSLTWMDACLSHCYPPIALFLQIWYVYYIFNDLIIYVSLYVSITHSLTQGWYSKNSIYVYQSLYLTLWISISVISYFCISLVVSQSIYQC
jgi:hypothetical protein